MAFIELKNINKIFFKNTNKEQHSLKDINLIIEENDFITIIGGNGAGKSTLLNAISGNIDIDNGSILINNKDISREKEYERAKYISRVFQNPLDGSAPRMTVLENMSLALRRGEKRGLKIGTKTEEIDIFKNLLKPLNLGLEDKIYTEMGVLSGGQRQSISLIMATIKKPKLLLLDEHTAALDPKTQKNIMEFTNKMIKENGLTALMITHNLKDALNYGNKMLLMHQGKIVKVFNQEEKNKMDIAELYSIIENIE